MDLGLQQLRVHVLSPTDLAVSKISRLANHDREDIRSLVAAGLGVAFLPTSARRAGAGPEVAWLHITEPVCERTVSLVWREDHYLSAAVRRFQQFAVEYFAASPERVG